MRRYDARGGASLELVILAPFLLALLMLIVAFARFTQAKGLVDQAARDSARAATAQNSYSGAGKAIDAAVTDALRGAPSSCRESAGAVPDIPKHAFDPVAEDRTAVDPTQLESITVTVSCQVDLGDLVILPLGKKSISFTFTSPMDKYRGYQQ
ncbi:MAG TPA: TadE family protein [Nocardioides sp.]|nr:TadE family protein [Nocardioides sp.]